MGIRIAARHKFPAEQLGEEAERAHLPPEDISRLPEGREQNREVGTVRGVGATFSISPRAGIPISQSAN